MLSLTKSFLATSIVTMTLAATLLACGNQSAKAPAPAPSPIKSSTIDQNASAAKPQTSASSTSASDKKKIDITKRKLTIYNKKLDTLNSQLASKEDQRLQLIQAASGVDQQNVYIDSTKEGILGNGVAAGGAIAGAFAGGSSGGQQGSGSNPGAGQALTAAGAALGKGVNGEINAFKSKKEIGRILGDAQEQLNLVIAQIGSLKSEIRELEDLILTLTEQT